MADTHSTDTHHGPTLGLYMAIAAALAVCTASSFIVNQAVHHHSLTSFQGFVLILGVAIIKALLVAGVFMHLRWDWNLLYFLIIPTLILGVMMMTVLLPDGLINAHRESAAALQIDQE